VPKYGNDDHPRALQTWKTLAPNNIEWGFIVAQKTRGKSMCKLFEKIGAYMAMMIIALLHPNICR
jgi:hypothetical protein